MSNERDVAAYLYRLNAVRGPLRKHAQFAWAAGELALVQDEAVAAADQPMAEAVGADRASGAAGGHILDDSVVVPVPHFEGRFIEQDRELRVGPPYRAVMSRAMRARP